MCKNIFKNNLLIMLLSVGAHAMEFTDPAINSATASRGVTESRLDDAKPAEVLPPTEIDEAYHFLNSAELKERVQLAKDAGEPLVLFLGAHPDQSDHFSKDPTRLLKEQLMNGDYQKLRADARRLKTTSASQEEQDSIAAKMTALQEMLEALESAPSQAPCEFYMDLREESKTKSMGGYSWGKVEVKKSLYPESFVLADFNNPAHRLLMVDIFSGSISCIVPDVRVSQYIRPTVSFLSDYSKILKVGGIMAFDGYVGASHNNDNGVILDDKRPYIQFDWQSGEVLVRDPDYVKRVYNPANSELTLKIGFNRLIPVDFSATGERPINFEVSKESSGGGTYQEDCTSEVLSFYDRLYQDYLNQWVANHLPNCRIVYMPNYMQRRTGLVGTRFVGRAEHKTFGSGESGGVLVFERIS
jgi:hypothetical protein